MRSFALITLAIGLNEAESRSHRLMKAYAERMDWDFHRIDREKFRHRPNLFRKRRVGMHLEKFQLLSWLDRYERIIYLDSDILVHPDCPDVLPSVPLGMIGCVYDDGGTDAWKRQREMERMEEHLGPLPERGRYFNGGVLVLDQSHRGLFGWNKRDILPGSWPEQTLLNYRVRQHGIQVKELDCKFNFLPFMPNWENDESRRNAWFIHYAGTEAKIRMDEDFDYFIRTFRKE